MTYEHALGINYLGLGISLHLDGWLLCLFSIPFSSFFFLIRCY